VGKFKELMSDLEEGHVFEADFVPVIDESTNSKNRTEEVQELLVKMILLSRKRGRPSMKDEDIENAA
jgi:hypothetical protein